MTRICNHLDEPSRILFFTIDEGLAFFLPFLGFLIFGSPVLGFLIGGCLAFGLKQLKGKGGQGSMARWLYWHLPPMIPYRLMPSATFKHYLG